MLVRPCTRVVHCLEGQALSVVFRNRRSQHEKYIIRFLADRAEHSVSPIDAFARVVPVVSRHVPERRTLGMNVDTKVKTSSFAGATLDLAREI